MIKKSGLVLVVLLYLVTATGFALNLHFCGSIIESVKVDAPTQDCGMDSKCCKDTHVQVKVKDAHQISHTVFTGKILAFAIPRLSNASSNEPLTSNHVASLHSERGPPPNQVPIFIQNCTFRI